MANQKIDWQAVDRINEEYNADPENEYQTPPFFAAIPGIVVFVGIVYFLDSIAGFVSAHLPW
ncbi:MAG: hypothetical protein ABI747_02775 [Candidatus Moraniibacteriota bacterium]